MTYRARFVGLLVLVLCSAVPTISHARENSPGILEYLDDPLEARIITPDGTEMEPFIGQELEGGTIIQTYESTAEIRLQKTGSLLRLAEDSMFRLEGDRSEEAVPVSAFSLAAGTIRCVAARVSGQDYVVHTQSAVLGVRGTDFVVEVVMDRELLSVLDGAVETLHRASGRRRLVETGYSMDVADEEAEPEVFDEELRDLLVRMNSFRALDPMQVVHQPGYTGTLNLLKEARQVTGDDVEDFMETVPGTEEDRQPAEDGTEGEDRRSLPGDSHRRRTGRKGTWGEEKWSFILSAGLHPALVVIAESTWTNLLGVGFGGGLSLTAGLSDSPGFYGGLTGGVYSVGGKPAGGLEGSLWIPAGFLAGIRSEISRPLSFFVCTEGGMQYSRFTYSIENQAVIEGWVPYLMARLGLRYELDPLILEAGAAPGVLIDTSPVPFVRIVLGAVYEVRL